MVERDDGYLQDPASQWVTDVGGCRRRPSTVIDLCAAPGGKATGLAGRRCGGGRPRAAPGPGRAGGRQRPTRSARRTCSPWSRRRQPPPLRPGAADRVLVDAPCSGLGSLRRRPDARWRIERRRRGPAGRAAAGAARRGRRPCAARRRARLLGVHPHRGARPSASTAGWPTPIPTCRRRRPWAASWSTTAWSTAAGCCCCPRPPAPTACSCCACVANLGQPARAVRSRPSHHGGTGTTAATRWRPRC